jgi:hypothetical protein
MGRVLMVIVFLLAGTLAGLAVWARLDKAGYVPHDERTIVYGPDWQNGEYKTCSTLNGNGYKSPEHSSRPQNILCDGGVPSGLLEDGKVFKVRFWGRTYVNTEPLETALLWDCRKNGKDDPAIACKQELKPASASDAKHVVR